MSKYKISVSIDGENFFWIVIHKEIFIINPTKKDLMGAELKYYNITNTCDICRYENRVTDSSILYPKKALRERDTEGNCTGRWLCERHNSIHRQKLPNSRHNIIKSLANCRTGNQDPNSNHTKGNNSQELACKWKGWVDLNIENDNYRTPIDCYDPKTGLYYQIKSALYDSLERSWHQNWENVHNTDFVSLIFLCKSKDGKIIERIYEFPKKDVIISKSVNIFKHPSKGGWYKKYRVTDESELKKVNDIWKDIIDRSYKKN